MIPLLNEFLHNIMKAYHNFILIIGDKNKLFEEKRIFLF